MHVQFHDIHITYQRIVKQLVYSLSNYISIKYKYTQTV